MLTQKKPKTAAGHRAMKKKEPVEFEGAKTAIFLKSTTTSQKISGVLKDLFQLKKPDGVAFSKRNDIRPFEDVKPLEFFSLKNNASLFFLASHSKKRPDNLVITRTFDHQMLDMIEFGVEAYLPMSDFKTDKPSLGNRPLILFNGQHWEDNEKTQTMKSILLDTFTGDISTDKLDLQGLSHSITFAIQKKSGIYKVMMRCYNILLKKSGTKVPLVELEEMGPSIDFVERRVVCANADMWRDSMRQPAMNKPKAKKNTDKNEVGEKVGRVWIEKQDLSKMQTRKMKGLKRKSGSVVDESNAGSDGESINDDSINNSGGEEVNDENTMSD